MIVNTKVAALSLVAVIAIGLIYTHPAYAHNFGGDESAAFLAKVPEIKTEMSQMAKNVSNKDAVNYYADAVSEYWNTNDTREMNERNALLAKEIPSTINATIVAAHAGDAATVNANIQTLNGYLDEAIPVRIDPAKLNNSTVQALAIMDVLKESVEKYGHAINSTVDLNDMSQMNMISMNNTGSMSGMKSSSVMIVDDNAYENSIALATTARQMFNDLASKNPDKSTFNNKISDAFTKYISDLNAKVDGNTVMVDVHGTIHPDFISGYNLTPIPEFPTPVLLVIVSIIVMIAITRFRSIKLRQ